VSCQVVAAAGVAAVAAVSPAVAADGVGAAKAAATRGGCVGAEQEQACQRLNSQALT
jgi:hypothetical protein